VKYNWEIDTKPFADEKYNWSEKFGNKNYNLLKHGCLFWRRNLLQKQRDIFKTCWTNPSKNDSVLFQIFYAKWQKSYTVRGFEIIKKEILAKSIKANCVPLE
jgi:hypothetical protein